MYRLVVGVCLTEEEVLLLLIEPGVMLRSHEQRELGHRRLSADRNGHWNEGCQHRAPRENRGPGN